MLVRDLPPGERPMERLAHVDPQNLKASELLAIILGGDSALSAAEAVLSQGLGRLRYRANDQSLTKARRARLIAFIELARRLEGADDEPCEEIWHTSHIAARLIAKYSREPQERLGVVLLDARRRIIAERVVYVGHQNGLQARPRWIVKHALAEDAAVMIVFHNHPSGDPTPSSEDVDFTERLKTLSDDLDIELFDHVVIGRKRYYSFREYRRL